MRSAQKKGKIIIFSAPSGSGKTTIVYHLLREIPELAFSVSCATRAKRTHEVDGKNYYFVSLEAFRKKIRENAFLEWEQVYPAQYYGTLTSELERIWDQGKTPIFDIDVVGGRNLKRQFSDAALAVFVKPPSLSALQMRLRARNTESEEKIGVRMAKATQEMAYQTDFDRILINDDLARAKQRAKTWVLDFLTER
ncbi:MAG: guanylate kinase [Flavobacteriales bacterium]